MMKEYLRDTYVLNEMRGTFIDVDGKEMFRDNEKGKPSAG